MPRYGNKVSERPFTGAADVQAYQVPADLQPSHDLTDLQQLEQNAAPAVSAVVYSRLLELIDR